MGYKGRVVTFAIVLIVNSIYIAYYYAKDGYVSTIEFIGLPILLSISLWVGKQYDKVRYYQKILQEKEKKLTQKSAELEEIFDNAEVLLWANDLVNKKIIVSKGIEKLFGYTTEDYIKNYDFWLDIVHPDDRQKVNIYYQKLLSGVPSIHEWRAIRPDGQIIWIQGRGNPIFDNAGKLVKLIGVVHDITKIKEIEKKIRDDSIRYRQLIDFFPEPILIQRDGKIVYVNETAVNLFGANQKNELIGKMVLDVVYPEDKERVIKAVQRALQYPYKHQDVSNTNSTNPKYIEQRIIRLDGNIITLEATGIAIDFEGCDAVLTIGKDISQRKKAEEELLKTMQMLDESEKKYRTLFENASDITVLFDISGNSTPSKFIDVNHMAIQKLGYSLDEFRLMSPLDITPIERINTVPDRMKQIFEKGHVVFEGQWITKNKEIIDFEFNASLITLNDKNVILSIARDITKRKKLEETIKRMAYYDNLTGLPNRFLIKQYTQKSISRSKRQGKAGAVMFVDLDGFKEINDKWGHHAGDQVLKEVANRLQSSIREGDIAGRLSGDEFVIILDDSNNGTSSLVAKRLIQNFSQPIKSGTTEVIVTPSIGISLFPFDSEYVDDLIYKADEAMYIAKKKGKNTYCFYNQQQIE
ncbi:hypothetical protein BKP45_08635 [Anaerobacillus alkalidiazotrophicus]|uniref:Diguanylate cyclase n=1 Tax=Anaerobacillus alkalidiazotrophicus TaxID=472963 RepID=A0A1S2M873_9BACI|nr:PAS domain S-box protein [Anaerobacillus alkalidiazotrophicus]OIJ20700.1 hypothetical protein BKP45_08635 [Anaerobacillus alkalidiazotrophicus]